MIKKYVWELMNRTTKWVRRRVKVVEARAPGRKHESLGESKSNFSAHLLIALYFV